MILSCDRTIGSLCWHLTSIDLDKNNQLSDLDCGHARKKLLELRIINRMDLHEETVDGFLFIS